MFVVEIDRSDVVVATRSFLDRHSLPLLDRRVDDKQFSFSGLGGTFRLHISVCFDCIRGQEKSLWHSNVGLRPGGSI